MSVLCRVWATLFVLIALVACDEDSPDQSEPQSIFPQTLDGEREACEGSGGTWGGVGNGIAFVCYRNLPDANKVCETSSDCAGMCLARSRTCTPITPFYGCHEVISDAGLRQTVCLE